MILPINKQTVFISGAGRGLGSEIAKSFFREGANVVINYRKSKESAMKLSDSFGEKGILLNKIGHHLQYQCVEPRLQLY